jgi:pimeloyl-ACP methyl ester carboxylesterase
MRRRRTALVTAGLAASAVAGGAATRTILRRRRDDPEARGELATLPPDDLGFVASFDGTSIAVRASGDASSPVLLFVHGFSLDMTTWHYQWTGLSDRFRCVLLDLRSHGRSGPAASGDLSLSAMAQDVAAVLDAIDPKGRAVVVGHSLGGMAVLAAAEVRPELFGGPVGGVVLFGTAASDLLRGVMGSVTELLRPRLGSLAQAARRVDRLRRHVVSGRGDVGYLIARATQFGPGAAPAVVSHVVGLAARAPSRVWTDGLAELMDVDLRGAPHHVGVPAIVAVGDHDRVTPPAAATALVAELPKGRLRVVEGAGHHPMLERPDAVNAMLAEFADEVVPRRPRRSRRGAS